jgi:hypothetical protein
VCHHVLISSLIFITTSDIEKIYALTKKSLEYDIHTGICWQTFPSSDQVLLAVEKRCLLLSITGRAYCLLSSQTYLPQSALAEFANGVSGSYKNLKAKLISNSLFTELKT